MQDKKYDIVIVGGGILGVSLGYFLTLNTESNILILEKEGNVAHHTSSRNTGKVHAPFLYHPERKKIFAKISSLGYYMWEKYSKEKNIPFKQDGVIEIAKEEREIDILRKYLKWGLENGLKENEIKFLNREETLKIEPNVKCVASILCTKDASTDYRLLTNSLKEDYLNLGGKILFFNEVTKIYHENGQNKIELVIKNSEKDAIKSSFVINAAGSNSLDIAQSLGIGSDLTNLYFRGEYWISPKQFEALTSHSIYSVPSQEKFPFLDPHWIIKVDGHCEIGPNAVPVPGPYSYSVDSSIKDFISRGTKTFLRKNFWSLIFNTEFLSLASNEVISSLSKKAMINRVKRFIPDLNPGKFDKRGSAGIRSILIDNDGSIRLDPVVIKNPSSLHILNYNSPGATGVLPMSAMIVQELILEKFARKKKDFREQTWNIEKIYWDIKN